MSDINMLAITNQQAQGPTDNDVIDLLLTLYREKDALFLLIRKYQKIGVPDIFYRTKGCLTAWQPLAPAHKDGLVVRLWRKLLLAMETGDEAGAIVALEALEPLLKPPRKQGASKKRGKSFKKTEKK